MNMHVPQSELARAEVREFMMASRQYITPRAATPCMGLVQDAALAIHHFTARSMFLSRTRCEDILETLRAQLRRPELALPEPAILAPRELWTGAQLASLLIPPHTQYERVANNEPDDELEVSAKARCATLNAWASECDERAAAARADAAAKRAKAADLNAQGDANFQAAPWSSDAHAQSTHAILLDVHAAVADQRAATLEATAAAARAAAANKKHLLERAINMSPSNARVLVRNGELLRGRLDKSSVGVGSRGGLIHQTLLDYGPDEARRLFDGLQALMTRWMRTRG
jgi:DNA-directed RNA polymerase beta' subunit